MRLNAAAPRALASIVVAALGLTALVLVVRGPESPLERAAATVRKHARRGDVVLAVGCASPSDADRFAPARAVCTDGHAAPLSLLARFPRVLLAGRSPTLDALLGARFGRPRQLGDGVRAFRTSPVALDLRAALDRASVSRGGAACPRSGKRHACAGSGWRTVEPREVTIGGEPVECVFAHPSEDGLAIEAPLPASVTKLRGVAGLSDRAAARPGGPAVALRALVDGRAVSTVSVPNEKGLVSWSATLGSPATTLRLELSTPSQGARSFCVQAWGN